MPEINRLHIDKYIDKYRWIYYFCLLLNQI